MDDVKDKGLAIVALAEDTALCVKCNVEEDALDVQIKISDKSFTKRDLLAA